MAEWTKSFRGTVQELLDEFAPADLEDVAQIQEMNKISMRDIEDPKTLFSQITMITQKFEGRASALSNTQKVVAIILKAPEKYQVKILSIRHNAKLKDPSAEPTLKELKKGMVELYKMQQVKRRTTRKIERCCR